MQLVAVRCQEGVAAAVGFTMGTDSKASPSIWNNNYGIFQAQILVLKHLRITLKKGLMDIIVETDFNTLLNLIKHADKNAHPLGYVIEGCRNLI